MGPEDPQSPLLSLRTIGESLHPACADLSTGHHCLSEDVDGRNIRKNVGGGTCCNTAAVAAVRSCSVNGGSDLLGQCNADINAGVRSPLRSPRSARPAPLHSPLG